MVVEVGQYGRQPETVYMYCMTAVCAVYVLQYKLRSVKLFRFRFRIVEAYFRSNFPLQGRAYTFIHYITFSI